MYFLLLTSPSPSKGGGQTAMLIGTQISSLPPVRFRGIKLLNNGGSVHFRYLVLQITWKEE